MVTCGTYLKHHHLKEPARRDFFIDRLFTFANEFGWQLQAWALMSNHYHFVAASRDDPKTLSRLLGKLHMKTSQFANELDNTPGRRVWFQFTDTELTYQESYLARLKYVHNNPVHHKIVPNAEAYRWCSAGWFAQSAPSSFVKTVSSLKVDRVNVPDDF